MSINNYVNHKQLELLLYKKKWKKADETTTDLILEEIGKNSWYEINKNDLLNISKSNLYIIDKLWLNYSNNKFGFSVQKKIWLEVGGKVDVYDKSIYIKFADKVGWRIKGDWLSYSQLKLTIDSLDGCLPSCTGMLSGKLISDYYFLSFFQ